MGQKMTVKMVGVCEVPPQKMSLHIWGWGESRGPTCRLCIGESDFGGVESQRAFLGLSMGERIRPAAFF